MASRSAGQIGRGATTFAQDRVALSAALLEENLNPGLGVARNEVPTRGLGMQDEAYRHEEQKSRCPQQNPEIQTRLFEPGWLSDGNHCSPSWLLFVCDTQCRRPYSAGERPGGAAR